MTSIRSERPAERPPQGLTVGDYELLGRLGEGGMGVVHLARRPGGPRVALKVLRPHVVGDDEARRRLAREVNSLSRIRSRRVAQIVDADPWGDIPFVATRYVPGLSVHDHVHEEGPIVGDDLLWFAACLAEALAAVHDVGVLHRDVKPSNVLMEGRTPILIDFGLARLADDPRLTQTGYLLGTPGYLAPEILHGDEATAASDLHSWAATVAFAATSHAPFGRGPSMAIMDRVRRGEHDLTGVDERLEPVLAECLDPDPARRPSLSELRRWLRSLGPDPAPDEGPADDDGVTVPLAVATMAPAHEDTAHLPVVPTRRLPDDDAPARTFLDDWDDEDEEWAAFEPVEPPRRIGALERLRRGVLVVGGMAAAGAATAVAPYLALASLVVLVWLLRSGSLAASAVGVRRAARGRRWYDGPVLLLSAPWHLVAAVPGALALVLWSLGVAAAAALLCYAAAAGLTLALGVVGAAFAVALWCGPGSTRLRGPVHRVVDPLAARPIPWILAAAVVLGAASGLASSAMTSGTSWTPASGRPLQGVTVPDLPGLQR